MLRWEVPCHHTDIPGHDHGDEMMLVKMHNDVLVVDGCGYPWISLIVTVRRVILVNMEISVILGHEKN